jgi:cytochrome c oxidase subunit IV
MLNKATSQTTYYLIFGALLALTLVTVLVSRLHLGEWHTPVGLVIAAGKTALVAVFFMHLPTSNRLTWLAFAGGLFWLSILIGLTLSDYQTRQWLAY